MIMWNDQIDISGDVPLSRDILIQFWCVAVPGRGPYEGCSMAKFLEKGFKVINSYYQDTYIDIERYMNAQKMRNWSPISSPELPEEHIQNVVGGEMCAWEFGNTAGYSFYEYVTPPALAIFADKLWSYGEREHDEEYMSALSLFVFGSHLESDVFACIGSPLPPRSNDIVTYVDGDTLSVDYINACIKEMRENKNGFFAETAQIYARLLERIRAKIKNT
jgi:hypothetical protein